MAKHDEEEEKDGPLLTCEFVFDDEDWPVSFVLIESEVMLSRETLSAFLIEFAEGLEAGEIGLQLQGSDTESTQIH